MTRFSIPDANPIVRLTVNLREENQPMRMNALNLHNLVLAWIIAAMLVILPVGISTAIAEELAGLGTLPGADDPVARGLAIAEETERRDVGFNNTSANMQMILTNAYGETSERELRNMVLEITEENLGDWSLIVFDKPRDVDGTALLSHARILDPDDQWMYLPAVKRVKRISSVNKSGPFMGSEFAFEDFSSQEVGKYSYNWLRDEECGERMCHVSERTPLYEHSGYTRQVAWTDTTDYQPRKIEYYDRKDQLLKTLTMTDYQLYEDKHWRAHDLFMENHQTGKNTRLVWSDFVFQAGLTESDFTTNALKRAR
ncbi:outer membrane lipoprotein-sorting protein [Parvibaculaceae bacterium PLY_AMNH_Bact1]|nr:outer membrane lipoprotein-sorting protein [Parvibaculaceae bacterium PLY_AMNH_Bact1]